MSTGVPARSTVCGRPPMRSRASSTTASMPARRSLDAVASRAIPAPTTTTRSTGPAILFIGPLLRYAAGVGTQLPYCRVLASLRMRQRRQRSLISPLQRDAKRERFRTNAVRRRATHWRPHRHPTCRPGRPRAAPPNAPAAPHPRHAPHVVELRTSHHLLTQRPQAHSL